MSVHSNYYDDEDEYERDLAWEYRTEGRVVNHRKPKMPFFFEPDFDELEDDELYEDAEEDDDCELAHLEERGRHIEIK